MPTREEAEYAFHGQGLTDYAAGETGEARPVRAELELHGNAGDHAEDKIDSENASPEAGGTVPLLAAGFRATDLSTTMSRARPMVSWGKR